LLFGAVFFGPLPVPEGIRRCDEMLAARGREKRISSSAMRALGLQRSMRGDFDDARRLMACDRAIGVELGVLPAVGIASYARGVVELLADDPAAAERELRAGHENLRLFGDVCQMSQVAALLAEALYQQGRDEEATEWCDMAEQETGAADHVAQRTAKGARAKVLARQGDFARAEALAREAIALVDQTDFPNTRADARFDLAEVLADRDPAQAEALLREAIELYARKGNTVSLERACERLEALPLVPSQS
jgi:tetratricopeptide (TPR) repeat protein